MLTIIIIINRTTFMILSNLITYANVWLGSDHNQTKPLKSKEITAHMQAAYVYSALSYCNRRQVGCVLVKGGSIISIGYNGTPPGEENNCEDCDGLTKSTVTHAEENALRKLIKRTESSVGCHVFITTSPCLHCAEKLVDADVSCVYYDEMYKSDEGIRYLQNRGIKVIQTNIK